MRALRFDRYGRPDVLRIDEIPEPTPRAGEAKVSAHAVALNPLDRKVRAGELRLLPVFRGPPRGLGCDRLMRRAQPRFRARTRRHGRGKIVVRIASDAGDHA